LGRGLVLHVLHKNRIGCGIGHEDRRGGRKFTCPALQSGLAGRTPLCALAFRKRESTGRGVFCAVLFRGAISWSSIDACISTGKLIFSDRGFGCGARRSILTIASGKSYSLSKVARHSALRLRQQENQASGEQEQQASGHHDRGYLQM